MPRLSRATILARHGIGPMPSQAELAGDFMDCVGPSNVKAARAAPKKRARPEDDLHKQVRNYLELVIAPPGCLSRDRVIWFSIENRNVGRQMTNERTGKKFNPTANANKARGIVSGIPDVHIEWPNGSAWIELKAPKGDTSDRQDAILTRLAQAGAVVTVARSVDDVQRALEAWNVPTRESVF